MIVMPPASHPRSATLPQGYGCFRPEALTIPVDRILRLQGYRDLGRVRPQVRAAAEEMARLAEKLIEPQVHYCVARVGRCAAGQLRLESGLTFETEAFTRFLGGVELVVALVTTLGEGLDNTVIGMIDRFEPLEALLLETAGWLGIERATKAFHSNLHGRVAPLGYRLSPRMAPGYSYRVEGRDVVWDLEQQRELFALFAGHPIPVTLMESCAMKPKMSRSGLYGVLPAGGTRTAAGESHDKARAKAGSNGGGREAAAAGCVA